MKSTKWLIQTVNSISLVLILLFYSELTDAQTVSLDRIYESAAQHYPLINKADLLQQITQENDSKLKSAYLPSLQASAQATYQNEVTSFAVGNIIPPAKDQYKIGISANQTLFDGGETAAQREINKAMGAVSLQQNEVDLYAVKERASALFFESLLIDENFKITNATIKELQTRLDSRKGAFKYGTAQESEIFALEAETLKVKQQITSLLEDKRANIKSLNILTGLTLSENVVLLYQSDAHPVSFIQERPEYQFFDLKKKSYESQIKLIDSRILPRLSLFGEANYGRPGFNFLRTDFGESFLLGAKISWNISSLYYKKEDKNMLGLQQKQVDILEAVFTLNQSIDFNKKQSALSKLNQFIAQDEEIINLKKKVLTASAAKLENGTITVTDYISDVQSEQQAELNRALHQAQRLQAIEQLKLINGK